MAKTPTDHPSTHPTLLAVVPRAVRALDGKAAVAVQRLQDAEIERRAAVDRLEALIVQARGLGASWSVIGWAVGTSGEAARQRWGK